jgi:NTE family protein
MSKPIVGLALGGGAARGLAHIGVLHELSSAGIEIDLITGSSAGALVGALYAIQPDAKFVEEKSRSFLSSREFRMTKLDFLRRREEQPPGFVYNIKSFIMKGILITSSVTRKGFVNPQSFRDAIEHLVGNYAFKDLKMPFYAIAADIQSGEEIIMKEGKLVDALIASCSIPGIFPPYETNGKILVDGSWVSPVPVSAARKLGADFIIGVDISRDLDDTTELERGLNVMLRTSAITRQRLKEMELQNADVVIRPDVGHIHWANFSKLNELIELGRDACRHKIEEIKKMTKKGFLKTLLPKFVQ